MFWNLKTWVNVIVKFKIHLNFINVPNSDNSRDKALPFSQLMGDWKVTKRWLTGIVVPFSHIPCMSVTIPSPEWQIVILWFEKKKKLVLEGVIPLHTTFTFYAYIIRSYKHILLSICCRIKWYAIKKTPVYAYLFADFKPKLSDIS